MTESAAAPSRPSPVEDWGIVSLGYVVMALAALALVGSGLDVALFVTGLPDLPPMRPGEALALLLLGLVAVFFGLGRGRHRLCVVAPVLVAGLAGLGIWDDATGGPVASPFGMGANTAAAFLLLASAVALRGRGGRRASNAALGPALLAAVIALAALAGYVGRYELGYRWGSLPGMAIHTAVCVLLVAVAAVLDARRRLSNAELFSSWALALAAAGFLVLAVSWVAYRGFARLVDAGEEIVQAHTVDDQVRGIQLSLAELEGRRNAFLLTRDAGELADDAGEKARLRAAVAELGALAAGQADPDRRARIERLASLVEETLGRHDRQVRAVAPAGPSPGIGALRSPADLELRAELQAVIRRILSTEAELLEARQASAKHAIDEARGVIVLGVLFVFILGGGAVILLRRLLHELGESRGRFASIFASVAEGLVLQDRQGRIVECNGAAERVLGLDSAGLARRGSFDPSWAAVNEDGTPCPGDQHPAMVALRTGESQRDRILGVHRPDGALVWLSVNSEPIRDPSGAVRTAVTSFFDITARRSAVQALRDSEERFRSTFEDAGIGMAIVGVDGRWLRVNRALLRILGHEESWLLARGFQDVTHPDDLDLDLGQVRRLIAGELTHYQLEKRYLHADGHVVWIHLTGSLVRDAGGEPMYFVSQIEDITERKRAGEKLVAYAARLAEKNRELQDFAHVASHDLQEPLRKIQAFGDRLDRRAGERLAPEERDYLGRMRAAAARMSDLIEALLAYSRVASEARAFVTVSLDQVLHEALQDLELRVERTRGRIEAGPLPELEGDPVQLRQLFQNLVGNALKYHRPDVPPVVRVAAAPAPAGALPGADVAWSISVEDNGIGFEPRHAEAIFGVFHRLHARGDYEGTGVGLAVCRRIVDRHGGVIRAEGRPGEGARFVVVLPAARPRDGLGA